MKFQEWHNRPEVKTKGYLDEESFLRVADQFITLANDRNKKILATELQFALMFAAARYTSHVGKNIIEVDRHDDWINHIVDQFRDMLRENMADPTV